MESVDRRLTAGNYGRIGRRAKITKQHVSRVLKGESGATMSTAFAISMAAGVTLDELYDFIARSKAANRRVA